MRLELREVNKATHEVSCIKEVKILLLYNLYIRILLQQVMSKNYASMLYCLSFKSSLVLSLTRYVKYSS